MGKKHIPVEGDDMEMNINADADIPGDTHLNNPLEEGKDEQVEKLSAELEELKDKYLRQAAEFDNFRRRTAKERVEYIQTAGKETIVSLLEVLDDIDRASNQMETSEDYPRLLEGNKLVFSKLRNILQQKGLTEMKTIGEEFDVEKHEAITQIDAGEAHSGKVVDELEKGYFLNEKIIRFAKVVVGK